MSLIGDYDIDLTAVEAPAYDNTLPDDIYKWQLGDVYIQDGSKKFPEKKWIVFKYLVGDTGKTFSELFQLPLDPHNPTDKEISRLGFYKQRLVSLGIAPENVNTVTADDIVGSTGTFELRTANGYQNIRNFKVDGSDGSLPAAPKAAKPATAVDNPFA